MLKKVQQVIIYYLIVLILLLITHKISPTNLAGLGLDFWVFVIITLFSFIQLVGSIIMVFKTVKYFRYIFLIHLVAMSLLFLSLFYSPA